MLRTASAQFPASAATPRARHFPRLHDASRAFNAAREAEAALLRQSENRVPGRGEEAVAVILSPDMTEAREVEMHATDQGLLCNCDF